MARSWGLRETLCMARTDRPPHFIRKWRKFRGLSLEQLSERVGMTHGNLSRIERYIVPYNQTLLESLAEELRTDTASLIMRDPTDPEGIWSLWDTLDVPERKQFIAHGHVIKGGKTGTDD